MTAPNEHNSISMHVVLDIDLEPPGKVHMESCRVT